MEKIWRKKNNEWKGKYRNCEMPAITSVEWNSWIHLLENISHSEKSSIYVWELECEWSQLCTSLKTDDENVTNIMLWTVLMSIWYEL